MNKMMTVVSAVLAVSMCVAGCKKETPQTTEAPSAMPAAQSAPAAAEQAKSGEELFKMHCSVCHPDGGNIVKPEYTLHKKSMAGNKVTTPEDIVRIMRNPQPGMTKFDEATISDKDAKAIAEYILKTY